MSNPLSLSTLFYLTIPIIVILLWIIFRRRKYNKQTSYINNDYFKGLNYLLNDEQGKALDIFVKLVESNWDIIETHFALGSIFRKNGEIDKAIKIHQGLMARPSLPEKYRGNVLLELGYDYLGAGWFDRAEGLFKEVLIHDKRSKEARRNLIIIYQQEKDWHKAINIASELFKEEPAEIGPMIAQYYCELADIAKNKGDMNQVEHNAEKALSYDADSVRATFLLSYLATEKNDYKSAINLLKKIEQQDEEFLPMIMESIIECYHQLQSPDELLQYLEDLENKHKNVFLLDKSTMAIDRYKGRDEAAKYLVSQIRKNPSMKAMRQLLEYKSSESDNAERAVFSEMKNAVSKLQKDHTEYQCRKCGFQANTLYWLCPSCKSWAHIKPTQVEKL